MRWTALQLTIVAVLATPSPEAQTSAHQQRFNRFDRNGDGKITAEELGMPKAFEATDKNGGRL
jgi:Ca2+-binding EF-hand superfamily protein